MSLPCTLLYLLPFSRSTHTERGLTAVKDAFTDANGGRSNAPNFLIVITDGESNKPNATKVIYFPLNYSFIFV